MYAYVCWHVQMPADSLSLTHTHTHTHTHTLSLSHSLLWAPSLMVNEYAKGFFFFLFGKLMDSVLWLYYFFFSPICNLWVSQTFLTPSVSPRLCLPYMITTFESQRQASGFLKDKSLMIFLKSRTSFTKTWNFWQYLQNHLNQTIFCPMHRKKKPQQ